MSASEAATYPTSQNKDDSLEDVAGNDMDLCIQRHCHHSHAITSVVFLGNLIVTGSLDGTVSLINILFSELVERINLPVKCGGVTCISPSSADPSTGTFIAGTDSGRLVKVSFSDMAVVASRAHTGAVTRVDAMALARNRVISSGADGCIRVCEADALERALVSVRVHAGSITAFVCFSDGTMWTGGSDGLVRKWQLNDALSAAAGSRSMDLDGVVIRHRGGKERVQALCRINFDIAPDERTCNHIIVAYSDGSIRWFESGREMDRQSEASAAAALAAANSKAATKSDKGGKKGKEKGSPKGKGKKGSKKGSSNDDDSSAPIATPFEGLWVIPGGHAAAAIETASTSSDSLLVAAGEDGRVYIWAFPRKSSGGLCFGRSRSAPDYVMQGFCSGGLPAMALTLLGATGSLLIAAGGVQHALFVLDCSNFQDSRKISKINEERLKRKIEKTAAALAAMKVTAGGKGGKGKKGKGKGEEETVVAVDVTLQEDDPSLLEPLPLPRYTCIRSIMLPHPGLPRHLQMSQKSNAGTQAASLPFHRSRWSIVPTRLYKQDYLFPLLGVRVKGVGSSNSGGEEKKSGQFLIQELFPSSPLVEHGVAEGDSLVMISANSVEILFDGEASTYSAACELMHRVDVAAVEVKCVTKKCGRVSVPVGIQQHLLQSIVCSDTSTPFFTLLHSDVVFSLPPEVPVNVRDIVAICNEFLRYCHALKSCYDWAASHAAKAWLQFVFAKNESDGQAAADTPPSLAKGRAPLGTMWIALALFVPPMYLPPLAEATALLHTAFVPSVLHTALPPPPSDIFNPWRVVTPKEFTCALLRFAIAAAVADSDAQGGGLDVVFHVKEMLKNIALAVEAVGEDPPAIDVENLQRDDRTFVLKGFVSALTDADIASVFHELGLALWKVATTFAIGTPPEQLMSPRQFCALMDAVGMPLWSVHRALDRIFQGKRSHVRLGLLVRGPPYDVDSERRFTFAEFCYALLLVSDDLSNEQLMSCSNAERILAKRAEAQEASAAAASSPKASAASSPKLKAASLEADSSPVSPVASYHQDTPRSSRLLLFVLGILLPELEALSRKPLLP